MEHHIPTLIYDLALILGTGALVTLLFRKIKQPVVLGYIIAGFLIGPHLNFFVSVADEENISTLADIGVIFLLFGLGLEFSFKKLMRVGGSASITALVEIAFIFVAGYLTGQAFGWSQMDCLFLGGMLASSSTTIIIRAFDELGVKTKSYAKVVFGVLVVEDIVVILLMVLLSTVAVTQHVEGKEMLFTVGKLLFFLILWLMCGIYLIPTLLKKVKHMLDDEGYLILSIGLCLAMVIVAVKVGFSAELGAFIMGSILAETTSAEKIEHITKPVKDLFGTIFFVSVGMMIDPKVMVEYGWIVLLITLLVIFGKFFSTTLGAILSGQTLKQSVQVGMSMAQIGEFAFIVATLGLSLGVISDFLFPIAVGASALTTFTTPYMIKYSEPFYHFLERILPDKWLKAIDRYATSSQTIQAESDWKVFVKSYMSTLMTNGIVVLALVLVGTQFLLPFLNRLVGTPLISALITAVVVLGISAPFLWALLFKMPKNIAYKDLWHSEEYKNGPILAMAVARTLLALTLVAYFIYKIFSPYFSTGLLILLIVVVLVGVVIVSRYARRRYARFEMRFMENYNSREIAEAKKEQNVIKQEIQQSPWNINLVDLEIVPEACYAGNTIDELPWREKYGINIVYIKRGEHLIYAPGPDDRLFPYDHIGITASDEDLEVFLPVFNEKRTQCLPGADLEEIVIEKIRIDEESVLKGKTIRDSGIRENTDGLVVGVEKGNQHFLNPGANILMEVDDIIWIAGDRKKLNKYRKEVSKN
ncbi:cation:proton antiporter [Bacteroidales bacterium OttesenSCG-928-A17]|nr:cation:proton antiporter [Bacteroidales bacterium OttesenSCG-928-A17]